MYRYSFQWLLDKSSRKKNIIDGQDNPNENPPFQKEKEAAVTNDEPRRHLNILGVIVAVFAMAFSKVLGLTLIIPIAFSAVAYFVASRLDKRLLALERTFGGFGTLDSSTDSFRLAFSVEIGHLSWGLVGVCIVLSGISSDFELSTWNYLELAGFFAFFLLFCMNPNWWSILLISSYHLFCIASLTLSYDSQLAEFTRQIRASVERGIVTHLIFHGLAVLLIGSYAYARVQLGDSRVAFWNNWKSKTKIQQDYSLSNRLEQLLELHRKGLITDSDLDAKKKDILNDL